VARVPLCSSSKCIKALERAGFEKTHSTGSHQAMRKRTEERTFVTIVVLGEREIARVTMKDIIEKAGMTVDEFMEYLK
jgi:predicted RNA binding protein YcfA (HicA-like mRNA interferase family)